MNGKKIRVLIVDDHAAMREGLRAVLDAQPDMTVAGEASDGREAIQQFRDLKPDVAVLDWNLPAVSGEEVLTQLGTEFPTARFIVITCLDDDDCARHAFHLGARSYLNKDMLRRELLPAIRAVHQGQQYVPNEIAQRLSKNR